MRNWNLQASFIYLQAWMSEWNIIYEHFHTKHSVFTAPDAHMHTSFCYTLKPKIMRRSGKFTPWCNKNHHRCCSRNSEVVRNYTLNLGLQPSEEDPSDTKFLCTTKLSTWISYLIWRSIFPNLFPQIIHTIDDHSNNKNQTEVAVVAIGF